MQFTMVHADRDPHFPSRVKLHDFNFQAVDLRDSSISRAMTFRGFYYFCHQTSVWYTVDDPEYYWRCDFMDEKLSDLVCHIYRNTVKEACGKYYFFEFDIDRTAIVEKLQKIGRDFDFDNL